MDTVTSIAFFLRFQCMSSTFAYTLRDRDTASDTMRIVQFLDHSSQDGGTGAQRAGAAPATGPSRHLAARGSGATPRRTSTVLSDLSERIHYNIPELPIYARLDPLSSFPDHRCPCHWHRDLEFLHVVSGRMHYFVNGTVTVLHAGEGIAVNSSRLHYGFSPDLGNAWFACAVISPALFEHATTGTAALCSRAFGQDMDDFLTLSPDAPWQRDMLAGVDRVVESMARAEASEADTAEGTATAGGRADSAPHGAGLSAGTTGRGSGALPVLSEAMALCAMAIDRFRPAARPGDGTGAATANGDAAERRSRITVLAMTGLIQRRFHEPLGLDDIAAAGNVSRSQCCMLFRRYVGRTPNEYLTERRLEEAKRLLADTAGSVAEIARVCGFSSSSYFISVFRRRFGETPRAYRAQPSGIGASGISAGTSLAV